MVDLKQRIQEHLFLNGAFSRQRARSSQNRELVRELEAVFGKHDSISETVYIALGGNPNTCHCGKKTEYISFTKGYRQFCSSVCMNSASTVKKKRVASIKKTCQEKYGVPNVFHLDKVKALSKETMLRRYGVDNFAKHPLHRELVKETSNKKYLVDHPLKSQEVKQKIKQKMEEKYGGFTTQSAVLSKRMQDTMLKRYGAKTSWESDILLPKLHAWQKSRYLKTINKDFKILAHSEDVLTIKHHCGHEFSANMFERIRCPACKESSTPEYELYMFVASLGINVIRNDRILLNGKELDLVIPDHKIAIELNGAWWHHDDTDKVPLRVKSELAEKAGYQLIHIWDYEWDDKQEIIKSMLKVKLGMANKIAARNCIVREISSVDAKNFLETYHLQGSCRSSIRLGLFHNEMLVGVATFGKARFKNHGTEVLRVAFINNVQVIGGVSKLLSKIKGPLMTYADLRYGTGNVYERAGFIKIGKTNPGYSWFSRGTLIGRYETQKTKLPKLLGEHFNAALSEAENMKKAGFLKLVDCGHAKFFRP